MSETKDFSLKLYQKRLVAGPRPDLLKELSAYSALPDILAGFIECGQGQEKGEREKTGGDEIGTAGEGTEEGGKGLEGRKDGKDGEKGKGWAEISPPRSFLKVGAYA